MQNREPVPYAAESKNLILQSGKHKLYGNNKRRIFQEG
jgi:hypothetical protein